jgi:hypothetical protein
MRTQLLVAAAATAATAVAAATAAAAWADGSKPEDTEFYKPVPPVVTPGARDSDPPSDAVVLFDGEDLSQWVNVRGHGPAGWTVADGVLTVNKPAGNIETKQKFSNYQLHIEWRIPANVTGEGQLRGNSGVFLASTGPGDEGYELQIMDSYENPTYVNGQAASLYKQSIPLANAARKPGQWQSYDVIWMAPVFRADGALARPAHATVFHNGVLVQNDFVLKGVTLYNGKPFYKAHGPEPIKLQAHGDPSPGISFRNIWLRPLPSEPGGLGDQPGAR